MSDSKITSSSPNRSASFVAPPVPDRNRPVQFGMWTMLVLVSIGGPLMALALLVPREFYALTFTLVIVCGLTTGAAFFASYLWPHWSAILFGICSLTFMLAYVAVLAGRFQLPAEAAVAIIVAAWFITGASLVGALLSWSRFHH